MSASPRLPALAVAAATLLAGGLCHAGVTLVFQRGQKPSSTMSIDGGHLRVDGGERGGSVLIDGPGKRQIVIDDARRTYMVVTPEDMRRQRQRMAEARAQAETRLRNMPPEERHRLEAMVGKKMPLGVPASSKPPVVKYERMNARRSIAGFPCEMYRVTFDGKPRIEECVAAWGANVVQKSDLAGVRPFLDQLTKATGVTADDPLSQLQKAPGFPISRVMLDDGGERGPEDELKSVKRGPIPAEMFAVPSGYAKTEVPMMGPPGTPGAPPRGGPFRPLPPPK